MAGYTPGNYAALMACELGFFFGEFFTHLPGSPGHQSGDDGNGGCGDDVAVQVM